MCGSTVHQFNYVFTIFMAVKNSFMFVAGCQQWLEIGDMMQFLHVNVTRNKYLFLCLVVWTVY